MADINPRAFRDTLGRFPTGVTVITTVDATGKWHGVTIGSFASLSLQPPLVCFSLDKTANCHPAFMACDKFAVNVLAEDQRDISGMFASKDPERPWDAVPTRSGNGGVPLIEGSCACIECELEATYPGGDHDIIVGRVVGLEPAVAGRPLVFFGGGYHRIEPAEVP